MNWLDDLPSEWSRINPRRHFRDRRELSLADDRHLTPSQLHGVLPQDEYMRRSGSRVVLNLTGSDSMKHVEPGDAIAHLRSFQGGLETSTLAGKVSTAYTVIEPLEDIHPGFYRWVFKSSAFVSALASGVQQLRDGQSIRFADFASIELPLPPTCAQRRIAAFLDDRVSRIDRIIAARREQIDSIQSIPWLEFDAKLAAAPQMPLRRAIATLADGPFGSAYSSNDYVESGPAVIRLGNIGFNEFRGSDLARVPESLFLRFPRAHVTQGDLLIASLGDRNNHAGRACLVPSGLVPAMVKGKCFRARPNRDVASAEFLAVLLSSPRSAEALVQQGTGATRSMLNFERLLSCRLPIPDRSQQAEIVEDFDERRASCQDAAVAVTDSINLLTEYKTSLITAAVTGELDVTTAGSNIPG